MTTTNDIRAALEAEIANVTGIPSAANRAWENVRFKPTPNTSWVRMTLSPTGSRPAVRGPNPQLRYDGLFLVDVFVPEANGPAAADTLADNIRNSFTVDDVLTSGSTSVRFNYSERGQGFSDSPWYVVPVSISWYTYQT